MPLPVSDGAGLPQKRLTFSISIGLRRLTFYVVFVLLASQIFLGPFRFIFGSIGLFPLLYLPKFFIAVATILIFTVPRNFNIRTVVVLSILAFSIGVGIFKLPSAAQPFFGVWILLPFIFSIFAAQYFVLDYQSYRSSFYWLFLAAAIGVLANYLVTYPWTGEDIEIAGQSLSVSRDWQQGGYARLAGFSGASFEVADQLGALAIFLVTTANSKIKACLIWIACGICLVLTTEKASIFGYVFVTIFFLVDFMSRRLGLNSKGYVSVVWFVILFILIGFQAYLPLANEFTRYQVYYTSPAQQLLLESVGDRFNYTWPTAFSFLNGGFSWMFGNGIGGIGGAQSVFDPGNFNAADNLFVYLIVQFGLVLSIAFYAFLLLRAFKATRRFNDSFMGRLFFPLALFCLSFGLTANGLEDQTFAFFMGIVVAGPFVKGTS